MLIMNGMPADQLLMARWRKSRVSNPSGSCVEIAELAGGVVAVRNSRDKSGPALVYPRAEVAAFLQALKNGEFDQMLRLTPPQPGHLEDARERLRPAGTPKIGS